MYFQANAAHSHVDIVVVMLGLASRSCHTRLILGYRCGCQTVREIAVYHPALKVSGIEAVNVVVGDEGTMLGQMMVKSVGEIFFSVPLLKTAPNAAILCFFRQLT